MYNCKLYNPYGTERLEKKGRISCWQMLACFIVQINLKNYQYSQKNLKPSQSKLTSIVEKLINNENTEQ